MSELKVDKITPRLGTTLTLGDSGDTINFGSGVLPNFENLTVTGDLTVDTNSLKVDSTNNFVGIGTASPTVALDVVGAITATGNITGTLATAAQPNITSVGTLTSATISGDLTVDTNTLYVDSTNNRVGILATNPTTPLHIQKSALTGFIPRTASNLTLESSGGNEIYFASGDSSYGQIRFGDTASTYSGGIQYEHSADHMLFVANGSEKMRIGGSELVINENSLDYDFRVESNNSSVMFKVDGGTDTVSIGTSNTDEILNIDTGGAITTVQILSNTEASLLFNDKGGSPAKYKIGTNISGNTGNFEIYDVLDSRLIATFDGDGNVGIGTTSPSTALEVAGTIKSIVTDNSAGLVLESTDDDALAGPKLTLFRNSATPADGDVLGQIAFNGTNDNYPEVHGYARIESKIQDASNATEDGILDFLTSVASSEGTSRIYIDSTGVTINDASIDSDFRVESDGLTHAFHLDGTDGRIGIGTTAISGARLQVSETSNGVFAGRFTNSHATGSYGIAVLGGNSSSNYTADFATKDGTSLMRIRGDGNVGIGTTSPATPLHLTSTSYPQFRITNAISFSMGVDSNNDLIFDPTSGSTRDIIFQNSGAGDIRVGIGTTSPSALLDLGGAGSSFQSGQEKITIAAAPSPYSYYPSLSSHNRSYLHLTGSGGGSAFNTSIHGYQVANPAGGSYMRVASDLTNAYVFYHKTDVTGFKWYADYNKSSGDADFTPSTEVSFNFETDTGAIVFNESSRDRDFRVESNNNANMLFVDGGSDEVGIGTASPSGTLDIASSDANYQLVITPSGTNASGTINFNSPGSGGAKIRVQGTERVSISSAGVFNITGSLTVNGSAVGGGKVLQVVSATKTDTATTSSTTYGDITGLSVSITPSSASSKIYVVFSVSAGNSNGSANYRLVRNTTALAIGDASGSRTQSTISSQAGTTNRMEGLGSNYLDSPSTTSATTYKVQWRVQNSGTNIYLNRSSSDADNESHPRGSSTITVMEIGA